MTIKGNAAVMLFLPVELDPHWAALHRGWRSPTEDDYHLCVLLHGGAAPVPTGEHHLSVSVRDRKRGDGLFDSVAVRWPWVEELAAAARLFPMVEQTSWRTELDQAAMVVHLWEQA